MLLSVFSAVGYMCCKASWACSVYTSSLQDQVLKLSSYCAMPLCELRCLSREKKLNLKETR